MMQRRNPRLPASLTWQACFAGLALLFLAACQSRGNPNVIAWSHAERFSDPTGVVRAGIKAVDYQAADSGGVIAGQVAGQAEHYAWNRYTCEHTWYGMNTTTGKETITTRVYDVYDSAEGMERFPHRVTGATSRFWEGEDTDPLKPRLSDQVLPIDGIEFKPLPFVYTVGSTDVSFATLGAKGTPELSVRATFTDLPEQSDGEGRALVASCGAGQRFRITVPEELIDSLAQIPKAKYTVELQVLGVDGSPIRSLFIDPKDL
jgi:hypothetical protein